MYHYLVMSACFCRLLKIFQIYVFEKFFQEYHQSVKQFGSGSGPTFCRAWSGSKLFAKFISRWQLYVWHVTDTFDGTLWVTIASSGYEHLRAILCNHLKFLHRVMARIVTDFAETFLSWSWWPKTKQSILLSSICMPVAMETAYEYFGEKSDKKSLKIDGFPNKIITLTLTKCHKWSICINI